MRGAQDSVRHVYSDMVSINSGGGNGYTGAGIIQIQQRDLTNLHRTTEVVNSRVRRLWRCRSRRIGTVSRKSRTNGLSFTSFSNFEIVIWLSPPATSLNRVAPSLRKSDLHRIDGHNGIRLLVRVRAKIADFFHALLPRFHTRAFEDTFSNINTNYPESVILCQRDCVASLAATKIDNHLSPELV